MDQRPLVEGYIANFGISLDIFEFFRFVLFFPFLNSFWFLFILGPPYGGIGATIRIGREIRCLPYAGFFYTYIILWTTMKFGFQDQLFMKKPRKNLQGVLFCRCRSKTSILAKINIFQPFQHAHLKCKTCFEG